MTKRLLIVADTKNWCFARRAGAIRDRAPSDWDVTVMFYDHQPLASIPLGRFDVVFILASDKIAAIRSLLDALPQMAREPRLIVSHNSGLGRRTEWLFHGMLAADFVVINNWATFAWSAAIVPPSRRNIGHLPNGVCCNTFRPLNPIGETRRRKVIWCASRAKIMEAGQPEPDPCPESPLRLSIKGDLKGYSHILVPLEQLLRAQDVEVDFRVVDQDGALDAAAMCEWYNSAAVLVCASDAEGTPNIVLEAAACGTAIVSTPCGNIPEAFTPGKSVLIPAMRRTDHFLHAVLEALEPGRNRELGTAAHDAIQSWDWSYIVPQFFEVFNRVHAGDTSAWCSPARDAGEYQLRYTEEYLAEIFADEVA